VGETQGRVSNARVIAATNRDLRQEIRAGRFRADLYHRLSVFTIAVPALRETGEDRRTLLDHFREFYARQAAVAPFDFDDRALALWLDYGFPGNVRELRNIVIRLTTKHGGQKVNAEQLQSELDMESLEDVEVPGVTLGQDFKSVLESAKKHLQRQKGFSLDETVQQWERAYVEAALTLTQGNLSQAAKLLGIHRTTLYSRMQTYNDQGEAARAAH
jgi:DNA-binding NtrC family response regulator